MSHWSSIRRTKSFQAYRAIRVKARRQIFGERCGNERVVHRGLGGRGTRGRSPFPLRSISADMLRGE
jgi:hypothetical protein